MDEVRKVNDVENAGLKIKIESNSQQIRLPKFNVFG